jgi:hypothetical protein
MLTPKGLVGIDELPEGWGLLEVTDNGRILKRHGWPGSALWISEAPFEANLRAENAYMYSALRRMEIRGHLKEVYDGMPVEKA